MARIGKERGKIMRHFCTAIVAIVVSLAATSVASRAADQGPAQTAVSVPAPLDALFSGTVRPFLQQYCVKCHGGDNVEADLDLGAYGTMAAAAKDSVRWADIVEKLEAGHRRPRRDAPDRPLARLP